MKKRIFAIWIDIISTPLNPSKPAITASTKNTITKSITGNSFFYGCYCMIKILKKIMLKNQ